MVCKDLSFSNTVLWLSCILTLCFFFSRLYFIVIALSGAFSVTFSIVFAYVADCTTEAERSSSYGVVSVLRLGCHEREGERERESKKT